MFCPRCGSTQSDELKFCKSCGANLFAIRQVIDSRETEEKFDWGKTWVAEMFLSQEEQRRRKAELERQQGITPEVKRYNEIKAGVITSSVGIALAIFLKFFMAGLILSGNVPPDAIEIISRIWLVGIIPLFVGFSLIINGTWISKRLVAANQARLQSISTLLEDDAAHSLPAGAINELLPSNLSVTEDTTQRLGSSSVPTRRSVVDKN